MKIQRWESSASIASDFSQDLGNCMRTDLGFRELFQQSREFLDTQKSDKIYVNF